MLVQNTLFLILNILIFYERNAHHKKSFMTATSGKNAVLLNFNRLRTGRAQYLHNTYAYAIYNCIYFRGR